ncbi:MAG: response regulator [Magnetococcales bacterium]|nr:response regulator [Magnetococcales bacterium]
MNPRILIVDDDSAVCDAVRLILASAGFEGLVATSVHEAQALLRNTTPGLILLDWVFQGISSGLDYLRVLKQDEATRTIPVIMLTVKDGEADKVNGLEQGADDYITKPFSPRELLARIRTALRRSAPDLQGEEIRYDILVMNPAKHAIMIRDYPLHCTPMGYRLLGFFMKNPDRVHYRDQLLDLLWGPSVPVGERVVDVHVRQLRNLLKPFGKDVLLQTVRGAGYLFSTR